MTKREARCLSQLERLPQLCNETNVVNEESSHSFIPGNRNIGVCCNGGLGTSTHDGLKRLIRRLHHWQVFQSYKINRNRRDHDRRYDIHVSQRPDCPIRDTKMFIVWHWHTNYTQSFRIALHPFQLKAADKNRISPVNQRASGGINHYACETSFSLFCQESKRLACICPADNLCRGLTSTQLHQNHTVQSCPFTILTGAGVVSRQLRCFVRHELPNRITSFTSQAARTRWSSTCTGGYKIRIRSELIQTKSWQWRQQGSSICASRTCVRWQTADNSLLSQRCWRLAPTTYNKFMP